jgi:hypothetical protein
MVPDITESGSFETTESMPSPDEMAEKSIKPNFVSNTLGVMKKALKILLYTLCIILTGAYIGGMAFLLEEKSIYGIVMAVMAILVIAYTVATDKGGEIK